MFYRPENAVAADVIPFYKNGEYYLFYLRDYRDLEKHGEGTPWCLLKTKDFVHFEDQDEVIERGAQDEQDLYVFTGSVFEKDGVCYIFYTGHNPHFIEQGKPQECVMLATSTDMKTWKKEPDFKLGPTDFMEMHDFRDPFVFQEEESGKYIMLLATRQKEGANERRGYTAYAVSDDLWNWEVKEEPFYAPGMYFTHECPDLFKLGEWWYLVFSEFTDKNLTHYRMAKNWNGPWITPKHDTFDNRNLYAAKTVSDGKDRYVIGWNPTNIDDKDYELEQWGGNVVVHKIIQQADGQLMVDMPETVREAYSEAVPCEVRSSCGFSEKTENGWSIGNANGYSDLILGTLKDECKISFEVTAAEGTHRFSVILNNDEAVERGYYVDFDLIMQRMVFDRRLRKRNDHPFILETERKIEISENKTYQVECLIDGPVLEVYFDHKVALSTRMNELKSDSFGFACVYGNVQITNLKVDTVRK